MTESNVTAWRDLALQFDAHRIEALSIIRGLLANNSIKHDCGARGFLAAPPLSGEKVLAARIAALALRTPSDGVKPLKWGETSYGKPEAITVAGTYRITDAWDGGFNVNRGNLSFQSEDGRKNFPTIEAAKAAAQADYEQRILSALTPGKE